MNATTGLFAASDIAVARPTHRGQTSVALPFRDEAAVVSGADFSLCDFLQKTIIFGRSMVMFAGSVVVAIALTERIVLASNDGQDEIDLFQVLAASGCTQQELATVAILYHYMLPDGTIHGTSYNYDHHAADEAGGTLYAAGTGCWSFFENLNVLASEAEPRPPHERVFSSMLVKIASHSYLERDGDESLAHMYGGWFELTFRENQTFHKVPYAFKFWAAREGKLYFDGPVLFGWYHGDFLQVTRLDPTMTDGKVRHKQRNLQVPNVLGRNPPRGVPTTVSRPELIIHSVVNLEDKSTRAFVDTEGCEDRMLIEAGPSGMRVAWGSEIENRLLGLAYGHTEPDFMIGAHSLSHDTPAANDP